MRKIPGQALVEFVLGVPFLLILLAALVVFTQVSLLRQRALAVARFGTQLQSTGLVSREVVEEELKEYMGTFRYFFDPHWMMEIGRFFDTPASRFYHLLKTQVRCQYQHPLLRKIGLEGLPIEELVVEQRGDKS